MAEKIIIPESGELGDEIILLTWHKKEGDPVRTGDLIAEIEAQKGVLEIEAPVEGHVLACLAQEGESLKPGSILGYIGTPGEEIPGEIDKESDADSTSGVSSAVKIMPGARKLANDRGVGLTSIRGTGPDNTITVSDVKAYEGRVPSQKDAVPALLSKNQSATARAVSASHREIPAIHLTTDVDMTRAREIRKRDIRFDALFIKTTAEVLAVYPRFSWVMDDSGVRENTTDGIGCAVSVEDDLYTPILRNPRDKSLERINRDLADLIARVTEGTIPAGELKGFTVLLSNLGMYGVTAFYAIIPPGATAALAFGAIREVPVILENKTAARPVMTVTLTVDHRVINGAYAARFLRDLKTAFETEEGVQ